ncbi:MAG: ISNCY family transposase [Chloroflexi bacterium]|nr:ISNCY family transposase [Chloroflexota bacterium]
MNRKEQKRALVLGQVDRGELTAVEAGKVMGLSERHVRRLLAEYRGVGPKALAHGNRGRKPHHTLAPTVRAQVLELAQGKYVGFNHTHLTEKLQQVEEIKISRPSVRRILVSSGIKSPRKRRAPKHRQRRERRAQRGMMLQIDGSRHDWLEGRGPWLTLVGAIDDATGEVPYALFRLQEDSQGYFMLTEQIAVRYGLPMAMYSDRHSIFVYGRKGQLSIEEELKGEQEPTQFGRLLKELEIQPILALSPQAKGRIERLWGTFQDRLVSELRLVAARTLEEANEVLWKLLPEHNKRFGVEPAQAGSAYRALPKGIKLEELFCFKYRRTVANDNTVKLEGRVISIPPGPRERSYAKARVEVREGMDGSLAVYYQGRRIAHEGPSEHGIVLRTKHAGRRSESTNRSSQPSKKEAGVAAPPKLVRKDADGVLRPTAEHPWRRPFVMTKSLNR